MSAKQRITLTARADCGVCRGSGCVYENHGPGPREPLLCDCVFDSVPFDSETQAAIDSGEFDVLSSDPEPRDAGAQEGDE